MLLSCLTPAALAREAERLRHMAKHAADHPTGYTRDGWQRRCDKLARDLDRRAGA